MITMSSSDLCRWTSNSSPQNATAPLRAEDLASKETKRSETSRSQSTCTLWFAENLSWASWGQLGHHGSCEWPKCSVCKVEITSCVYRWSIILIYHIHYDITYIIRWSSMHGSCSAAMSNKQRVCLQNDDWQDDFAVPSSESWAGCGK